MRDPNTIDELDFEIVHGPSTTPVRTPPTSVEETSERDRSIKELFNESKETDPIQDAAKIIIKLSLPFAVAWTTFIAVVTSLYKRDSDERLLEQHTQSVLDSYRKRLSWVDEKLPEYLTRYKSDLVKAFTDAKSAAKKVLIDESRISNKLIRGLYFLGIYLLLQLIFPMLRRSVRIRVPLCVLFWLPIWITIMSAVRFKRCRRRSSKGRSVQKQE